MNTYTRAHKCTGCEVQMCKGGVGAQLRKSQRIHFSPTKLQDTSEADVGRFKAHFKAHFPPHSHKPLAQKSEHHTMAPSNLHIGHTYIYTAILEKEWVMMGFLTQLRDKTDREMMSDAKVMEWADIQVMVYHGQ